MLEHNTFGTCTATEKKTQLKLIIRGRDRNIRRTVTKILFKMVVQVWNFSSIHSTPAMNGCSNPSAARTAGNIVKNLQRKYCQRPPVILVEPLQRQQNASLLANNKTVVVSQPPYSLVLTPCDFFFVPRDESWLERDWSLKFVHLFWINYFNSSGNFWVPPIVSLIAGNVWTKFAEKTGTPCTLSYAFFWVIPRHL
jgi:hypothetical protein